MQDQSSVRVEFDASGLSAGVAAAADDIEQTVREDLVGSFALIDETAQIASKRITTALQKAADTGKLSFRDMARSIVADLAEIAAQRIVAAPIQSAVSNLFASLPFGGARAHGGAVAPGSAFLVGERGPELFAPGLAGQVAPLAGGGGGVIVNMNISGVSDAESFRRSQTQIAALLARAVERGQRNR